MPVKKSRNALSRKNRNDANPIAYSSSLGSQFSDTPATSAASSPPEHIPVLSITPDIDPSPSDPESEPVRETLTDNIDLPDRTVGYTEDLFDFRGPDEPADAPSPASPPLSKPAPTAMLTTAQVDLVDVSEPRVQGHVRSPNMIREPSTLESVSRTIRGIVPSSIPIPSVVPTPPRVSRPVSFGSFLTPSRGSSSHSQRRSPDTDDHGWKRRGSDASTDQRRTVWGVNENANVSANANEKRWAQEEVEEAVFNLDEEIPVEDRTATLRPTPTTTYPSTAQGDDVVSCSFGTLHDGGSTRQLALLGYRTGLQVWDCTNLGSVTEILNLSGPRWGAVEMLSLLPEPRNTKDDLFQAQRPLIGFISKTQERTFVVYSMRTHEVVKKLSRPSLVSFSASDEFLVLSTAEPAALHIYSSRTLSDLYTVPASALALSSSSYSSPTSTDIQTQGSVLLSPLDHDGGSITRTDITAIPQPIFALCHRLIVFASATPQPTSPHQVSHSRTPRTANDHQSAYEDAGGLLKFPTTQAELGVAAIKIGGTLFSGMKAIGGRAYSAARAGVSAAIAGDTPTQTHSIASPTVGVPPTPGKFFSRSAPEATGPGHTRRYSMVSDVSSAVVAADAEVEAEQTSVRIPSLADRSRSADSGHYITVMDLRSLYDTAAGGHGKPAIVAEYMVSKHQPVSAVQFSADGTSVAVALKDGQVSRVYKLQPTGRAMRASQSTSNSSTGSDTSATLTPSTTIGRTQNAGQTKNIAMAGFHHNNVVVVEGSNDGSNDSDDRSLISPPWHMYDLRRGRTSAVIERMAWAQDGRWLGVGTRKRTIHVFAPNPYGGPTEEASHLEGRVVNVAEVQPLSTELAPLVRLRASRLRADERTPPPCVFTFISPTTPLPLALTPPSAPTAAASHSISSSPSSARSASPGQHTEGAANHQDVLVLDPRDGALTLHRISLSRRPRDDLSATIRGVSVSMPSASISLPGVSTLSRLAGSTTNMITPARQMSALSQMMERSELVGQAAVVATWSLRRSLDWQDIKRTVRSRSARRSTTVRPSKADWLAQAELSTCSKSRRLVPKSIYLTHQFSFHYLGDDYHALLRSHRFDVPARKIDVRRQVAVSASAGLGESFVSGSSVPSSGGGGFASSSFDEPLASALSAELRHANPSPPQLPSYPNGPTNRTSGRVPIPIRVAAGISDGMSEGLGRLRREIGKVRSPKLAVRQRGDSSSGGVASGSVLLEFEEDDDDFSGLTGLVPSEATMSRSSEVEALSTPSTGMEPLPAEHEEGGAWQGWETEDKEAVEEVEQFDDIGVGFMDEEWMAERK